MGYNAVLLILNDGVDDIRGCLPQWWDKVRAKMNCCDTAEVGQRTGEGFSLGNVSAGCHCNPSNVLACNHADQTVVVAVGQNHGTVLGNFWHGQHSHHTPEGQIELIRQLAEQHGYRLVKKSG